jgi:hypothetical protein
VIFNDLASVEQLAPALFPARAMSSVGAANAAPRSEVAIMGGATLRMDYPL